MTINLSWDMWCSRHLVPLKEAWPKGAGLAMLGLFNAFAADPRIVTAAHGKVGELPLVINAYKPLCCFVGDEVMAEVTRLALEGTIYGESGVVSGNPGPAVGSEPPAAADGDPV
jgi:hypothetical protein